MKIYCVNFDDFLRVAQNNEETFTPCSVRIHSGQSIDCRGQSFRKKCNENKYNFDFCLHTKGNRRRRCFISQKKSEQITATPTHKRSLTKSIFWFVCVSQRFEWFTCEMHCNGNLHCPVGRPSWAQFHFSTSPTYGEQLSDKFAYICRFSSAAVHKYTQ